MDDSKYGSEDSRGYWTPDRRISYGPVFAWPPQPRALANLPEEDPTRPTSNEDRCGWFMIDFVFLLLLQSL